MQCPTGSVFIIVQFFNIIIIIQTLRIVQSDNERVSVRTKMLWSGSSKMLAQFPAWATIFWLTSSYLRTITVTLVTFQDTGFCDSSKSRLLLNCYLSSLSLVNYPWMNDERLELNIRRINSMRKLHYSIVYSTSTPTIHWFNENVPIRIPQVLQYNKIAMYSRQAQELCGRVGL